MNLQKNLYVALVAAAAPLVAVPALAEDFAPSAGEHAGMSSFPVQFVDRPLVMPKGMLGIQGALALAHISINTGFGTASDTAVAIAAGGQYGLIDNLEVGALVLPLQISPDFKYEDPSIYGLFRFVDSGGLEVGGLLAFEVGLDGKDSVLTLGIPLALHFGHAARLDTGVLFGLAFADPDLIVVPSIPLVLHFQATNEIAVGVLTGLTLPRVKFEEAVVPLSFEALYAIPKGAMPLADVGLRFGFPLFLTPGVDIGDKVHTELWTLTFFGTFYMNIM